MIGKPSGWGAAAGVVVTIVFLAAAAFAIGIFGTKWDLEPKAQWIVNGALVLTLLTLIALLAIVVAAIFAGGIAVWTLIVDKRNPFDLLAKDDITTVKDTASVIVLATLLIGGLAGIPFVGPAANGAAAGDHPWVTAEFMALGVLLVGVIFGFLFGLPHYNDPVAVKVSADGGAGTQTVATPLFTPSTNLEKIANQLVVLFSGAAFASLLTIPQYISTFAQFFETGITQHTPQILGAAILVYFGPLGFIISYVVTRTVGAQAFARSDAELMGIATDITNHLPPLPDLIAGPTAGTPSGISTVDTSKLNAAIAVPFSELDTHEKLQTWGRAQFVLGNFTAARRAFDRAYAMEPNNPRAVLDYATALYQDPSWTNFSYVLEKVTEAKELEEKDASSVTPTLRARTLTLLAATELYLSDGYLAAITTVNWLINSAEMPPQQVEHFYRACGLGQLAWAYANAGLISQGDADWNALINRICIDVTVAMNISDRLRQQVRMVADPTAGRTDPQDCDLQFVAAADPRIVAALQLKATPPKPEAQWLPKVVMFPTAPPAPMPINGALAIWIHSF